MVTAVRPTAESPGNAVTEAREAQVKMIVEANVAKAPRPRFRCPIRAP